MYYKTSIVHQLSSLITVQHNTREQVMGQCCSSQKTRNFSKKKKDKRNNTSQKNVSMNTIKGSYYDDNYINPVSTTHHILPAPTPAVLGHFCNCSISNRCPHRAHPITPIRRSEYSRRISEEMYRKQPVVYQRARRATLDTPPVAWMDEDLPNSYLTGGRYLSEGKLNLELSALDVPVASSSRIDYDRSCSVHRLGISWDSQEEDTTFEEEGIYGYRFVPRERTVEFEKRIIAWV